MVIGRPCFLATWASTFYRLLLVMAVEVVSDPREGKTKYVPGWKLQFFYNLIPEVTPYRFCLNHTVKSKSLGAAHTQAEEFYTKV